MYPSFHLSPTFRFKGIKIFLKEQSTKKPQKIVFQVFRNCPTNSMAINCRLCFGDMQQEFQVEYCKCRGSIGAMHHSCLVEWLNRKISIKSTDPSLKCEICHQRYQVKSSRKIRCRNLSQIQVQITDQSLKLTIAIGILLCLFIMVYLLIWVMVDPTIVDQWYLFALCIVVILIGFFIYVSIEINSLVRAVERYNDKSQGKAVESQSNIEKSQNEIVSRCQNMRSKLETVAPVIPIDSRSDFLNEPPTSRRF